MNVSVNGRSADGGAWHFNEGGNFVVLAPENLNGHCALYGIGFPPESGLTAEDKVIVQGLQKVANGTKVSAQVVADENSIVPQKISGHEETTVEENHPVAAAVKAPDVDVNSPVVTNKIQED